VATSTSDEGIDALYAAWADAFRRKDVGAILRLLTPDYILLRPGAPGMTAEAIRPALEAAFASVDIDMALRVSAYGPVAYIDQPLLDYTVRSGGMNKEVARKDRARARMTSHGAVLRSGLAVHEARRQVGDDERRYVRRMIAQSFIGRALQHRYLPDGGGRRAAIGNVARAFRIDPTWWLDPRSTRTACPGLRRTPSPPTTTL